MSETWQRGTKARAPLINLPVIEKPFSRIAIDIVGPLETCDKTGNRFILTIMDLATHFPFAIPLKVHTAVEVAKALVSIFTTFGFPDEVLSDQGTEFMSELRQLLMNESVNFLSETSPVQDTHTDHLHERNECEFSCIVVDSDESSQFVSESCLVSHAESIMFSGDAHKEDVHEKDLCVFLEMCKTSGVPDEVLAVQGSEFSSELSELLKYECQTLQLKASNVSCEFIELNEKVEVIFQSMSYVELNEREHFQAYDDTCCVNASDVASAFVDSNVVDSNVASLVEIRHSEECMDVRVDGSLQVGELVCEDLKSVVEAQMDKLLLSCVNVTSKAEDGIVLKVVGLSDQLSECSTALVSLDSVMTTVVIATTSVLSVGRTLLHMLSWYAWMWTLVKEWFWLER